ncbi:GGDEF domain-containing protein [Hydrogenovibrio kuenenii]|uniref:GGDEF domain-containing protein n=1 Tax=Hydrogenovibrio kuenenii TaxID=63658 RepID=UPI0004657C01|nr:sensor domain-containing diguanylate cyclase [Hydrogenovibrio kuenenii]
MANGTSEPRLDLQVNERMFDELMSGMLVTLVFGVFTAFLIVHALLHVAPTAWVFAWLFVNLGIAALRFYILYLYRSKKYKMPSLKIYNYMLTLAAGLVWASLIFFYNLDQPLVMQLMLLMVLGGMPIVSLSTHSHLLMSFLFFSFPSIIALNYWALFETPDLSLNFVVMTLIYTFLVYSTSLRFHNRIKKSYLTNLENESLVQALKNRQVQLENLAYLDPLTELNNRRYFTVSSELALEAIYHKKARLFFFLVDSDKFKHINDHYGHETGDMVLKHIANCLRHSVESFNENNLYEQGQVAEAARLGGDEFIISYVVLDKDFDIENTANALLSKIHQPLEVADKIIYPQASIGVSEAPKQALDVSGLLRLADKAMYQAKKRGGDQVFYCLSTEMPPEKPTDAP